MEDQKGFVVRGLGVFSLALGTVLLVAPRALARAIGLKGDRTQARTMRLVGVQEIGAGAGILAQKRPAVWLWGRTLGDVVHLALLAMADGTDRRRKAGAIGAVAGVLVPDFVEATRLSGSGPGNESSAGTSPDGSIRVRKAITIAKRADEVYGFWCDLENLPRFMAHLESVETLSETRSRWRAQAPLGTTVEWEAEVVEERPDELIAWRTVGDNAVDHEGTVRFTPAPGGGGTEVHVDLRYEAPGGVFAATVAKLLGEEPSVQLADDLRRLKQLLETGEIVRSDGGPAGHALAQQLRQRPAQPLQTTEEVPA